MPKLNSKLYWNSDLEIASIRSSTTPSNYFASFLVGRCQNRCATYAKTSRKTQRHTQTFGIECGSFGDQGMLQSQFGPYRLVQLHVGIEQSNIELSR